MALSESSKRGRIAREPQRDEDDGDHEPEREDPPHGAAEDVGSERHATGQPPNRMLTGDDRARRIIPCLTGVQRSVKLSPSVLSVFSGGLRFPDLSLFLMPFSWYLLCQSWYQALTADQ